MTTDVEHLIWIKNRLISLETQSNANKTDYIARFNKIIEKLQTEQSEKNTMEIFAKAHGVETKPSVSKIDSDYESLSEVLDAAYKQASAGKGKERHAGNGLSFLDQPMQTISKTLNTSDGLAFQAIKKVTEAKSMETFAQKERELLGAIVYTAGIIIYEKTQN
jgi:DNA repair ATPase RecN